MRSTKDAGAAGGTDRMPRLDILLGNYRESRREGMELSRSLTSDIAIAGAFIGAVVGGEQLAKDPTILLILPVVMAGLLFYGIVKFRVTSLITGYMIFLEGEINREVGEPLMLWNSQIIGRAISPGRRSQLGPTMAVLVAALLGVVYGSLCAWAFVKNGALLLGNPVALYTFMGGAVLLAGIDVWQFLAALRSVREYSPVQIERLAHRQEAERIRVENRQSLS